MDIVFIKTREELKDLMSAAFFECRERREEDRTSCYDEEAERGR